MTQMALFPAAEPRTPATEGIKYIGSKLKMLPYILSLAQKLPVRTVLDGFAGSTRVSQAFARSGLQVISNDVAAWSEVLGTAYLKSSGSISDYMPLLDHLNGLTPYDGWFTEHYGGYPNGGGSVQADGLKRPLQIHNTRKLDAIRDEIDRLALDPGARAVALTSLLLAIDRVDNTLGHFASYLREWSPRSYQDLVLKPPSLFSLTSEHTVSRSDVFDAVSTVKVDLAYFDPPYGSNNEKMPPSRVRYASYYHFWTTVCLHDKPQLFGKALRRADTTDGVAGSVFEEFRTGGDGRFLALKAIEDLVLATDAQWLILSYSSGGRATAEELDRLLRQHGRLLEVVEVDLKRNVMASMTWTREWVRDADAPNREFLFLLART